MVEIQCISDRPGEITWGGAFPKENRKEDLFLLRSILARWIGFYSSVQLLSWRHNFPRVQGSSSGWMWVIQQKPKDRAVVLPVCLTCVPIVLLICGGSERGCIPMEWETAAAYRDGPWKPILLQSHVSFTWLPSVLLITTQIVALAAPQRQLFHEDE